MATIKDFQDIEAWQKARSLTQKIYDISKKEPFSRDFGLRDQIRRAAISVMANIAEGFDRSGNKEFVQFLSTAKASVSEVRSHLCVALDQGYISMSDFQQLNDLTREIGRMIAGFMNYLSQTKVKGNKFKNV